MPNIFWFSTTTGPSHTESTTDSFIPRWRSLRASSAWSAPISAPPESCSRWTQNPDSGPSDHPDLADWLIAQGVDSLSLNPDTVIDTRLRLATVPRDLVTA